MAGVKGRSGRKKGSKNLPRRSLLLFIQERFPDYDPLLETVKVAVNENNSVEVRMKANETVLKYTYSPRPAGLDEDNQQQYQVILKQYVIQDADTDTK